jgi:hypothetical protein
MNIFFIDKDPKVAAEYLCDKHVPKMLLETAQMLSTALHQYTIGISTGIYKQAYPKHPMTIWVSGSRENFVWALDHARAIAEEYTYRYDKEHKSASVINAIVDNNYKRDIPSSTFTEPPQCMPDQYKTKDYVTAYRNYYRGDKIRFARWSKGREKPTWMKPLN